MTVASGYDREPCPESPGSDATRKDTRVGPREVKWSPEVGAIGRCCWDSAVGGAWPFTQTLSPSLKPAMLCLCQQPERQKLLPFLFHIYGGTKAERGQAMYLRPHQ